MGREYCLNIAHRWKLIGVDRIGPKIYLKLPKHGGNGGNGRYTEMRSYLRERRNHTMSVSEVRGENYGGNETRRRGGRLIAVKLHLLRWTRQREREREIERGREEEERKTERERERERERNDGRERQRGPSGEAPPSAGVCICARWRRSVGVCRGCTHFAHRSNAREPTLLTGHVPTRTTLFSFVVVIVVVIVVDDEGFAHGGEERGTWRRRDKT